MVRVLFFTICCMMGVFHLNACTEQELLDEEKIQISAQDLVVYEDEVFVNLNGILRPIVSLERKDQRWAATIIALHYCPQGHPLCGICTLCHVPKCRYYVDPRMVH